MTKDEQAVGVVYYLHAGDIYVGLSISLEPRLDNDVPTILLA